MKPAKLIRHYLPHKEASAVNIACFRCSLGSLSFDRVLDALDTACEKNYVIDSDKRMLRDACKELVAQYEELNQEFKY